MHETVQAKGIKQVRSQYNLRTLLQPRESPEVVSKSRKQSMNGPLKIAITDKLYSTFEEDIEKTPTLLKLRSQSCDVIKKVSGLESKKSSTTNAD